MPKGPTGAAAAEGRVDATSTYTHHALAHVIGRSPDWVIEKVIDQDCPAMRIGFHYLISGRLFNEWVADRSVRKPPTTKRSK